MSHEVISKLTLRDVGAIEQACQRLGWLFHIGGKVRYYAGQGQECNFTIEMITEQKLNTTYNLGLHYNADIQGYQIVCDNAMNLSRVLPLDQVGGDTPRILGKLEQAYNVAAFEQHALAHGIPYQMVEENGMPTVLLEQY